MQEIVSGGETIINNENLLSTSILIQYTYFRILRQTKLEQGYTDLWLTGHNPLAKRA